MLSRRQKCYGPDKKILFKKQLFDLEVKGQGPTKVITVCDTPPYGHAPTYQNIIDLSGKIKKLWSTSFADKKRKKKSDSNNMSPFVRRGDIIIITRTVSDLTE
jgi:hypothetical protein